MNLGERWRTSRAILVALGVAVALLDGCPFPRVRPETLAHPINQHELGAWASRLRKLGFETDRDGLATALLSVSERIGAVHAIARRPFQPLFHLLQIRQRWSLFPIADPTPYRFHLEARTPTGPWVLLYRPVDASHRYHADRLEYRRVRAQWNAGTRGPRPAWDPFVSWIAHDVLTGQTHFTEVRARVQQLDLPPPSGGAARHKAWLYTQLRKQDQR